MRAVEVSVQRYKKKAFYVIIFDQYLSFLPDKIYSLIID